MELDRFDHLTRSIAAVLSRRTLAGMLGLGAFILPDLANAKKHKKKKKVKRNDFGCVDVGKFCKNNGQCCSGICQGKKGKKKCQAHDQSTCQSGQHEEDCAADGVDVPCTSSAGDEGVCDTTTGKGAYCTVDGQCFDCSKDADCVPFCGPQAACITCTGCTEVLPGVQTACVGPSELGCTFPVVP